MEETKQFKYVGFWIRTIAFIIDQIILILLYGIYYIGVLKFIDMKYLESNTLHNIAGLIIWCLYFVILESSTIKSTIGKKMLGIIVVDYEGKRISIGRAFARYIGLNLSFLLIGIGVVMIAFTKRKQGLHDQIAQCLIIKER